MSGWYPIATAPKDGTLLDLWQCDDNSYSARIYPGICWGNSADRARRAGIDFWGTVYEGWYYADELRACSAFLQENKISHWRLHSSTSAPTTEQLANHRILSKLRTIG